MTIKTNKTLETCTIPDCWKVWVESEGSLKCVAIFDLNIDANVYAASLRDDENKSWCVVTRSSTICVEKE